MMECMRAMPRSSVPLLPGGTSGRIRGAAAALAGALSLAACSPAVDVPAAADAANPACAPMMVALPDSLGDAEQRQTNSQATAAWGQPSLVILRCGVNVPGPTTDRCVTVNGIDWLLREGDPVWTLTTYGRTPATEILMDPDKISSATVLAELANAAGKVPAARSCIGQEELQNLPDSQ